MNKITGDAEMKIITKSQEFLDKVSNKMQDKFGDEKYDSICVFACGSLGRFEMTDKSDLDLFFIIKSDPSVVDSEEKMGISNIDKIDFFAKMLSINNEMNCEPPSNGGEYWVFTEEENLLDIGSRADDFTNSFTARMLLLLESKPLHNSAYYDELVANTVNKYFKEYEEHKDDFYPLYLMNDILRYWYTLTLNFEYRRKPSGDANKEYWKRLKLKYARLLTCYSMIACLYEENITPEYVIKCVKMTPIERLNHVAGKYEDAKEIVDKIILSYQDYLDMRGKNNDFTNDILRAEVFGRAEDFHKLVIKEFMRVVSNHNRTLKDKVDVY